MYAKIETGLVKAFGTAVSSETERYVISLPNINQASFQNPKDTGTEWCTQTLKGNGADIMILNGLTTDQTALMDLYLQSEDSSNWRTQQDIDNVMITLDQLGIKDRYCSDVTYRDANMVKVPGKLNVYRRTKDVRWAVELPIGTNFEKEPGMVQSANISGALLIVNEKGEGHITNVPTDYASINPDEKIVSYSQAYDRSVAQQLAALQRRRSE